MVENYTFVKIDKNNIEKIQSVQEFLKEDDLTIDQDVEFFIAAYLDNKIIACAGSAGRILKSIAISRTLQGEGFALTLLTEIVKHSYELGYFDLFLFTKASNEMIFKQAGFFTISKVEGKMVLMENSSNRLSAYCKKLSNLRVKGDKVSSLVINANPFTLGHKFLVEKAASESHWLHLFVVREDASYFSFKDRFQMIKEGISHISNITIHQGSEYLISRATFPSYFIKDLKEIDQCHSLIDLQIFKNFIAKSLGITHRYVGSEPNCPVTNNYNQEMKKILSKVEKDIPAIEVIEVPRIQIEGTEISASNVRELFIKGEMEKVKRLVPASTFQYLIENISD